ncbi:MAG TPA: TerB family tellurite resistance protein [Vitreimonas sp.]|uniref:tellurite resistance TerB family protein n=1 Tax=Vitreimonas sp. TaxID=3069702 RepID=UPI002D35487E|nr:TerB family tellurite resistance protein [Vitreimonas sp.]HYD89717.1 TerB family tellurite resistance protein [Vitreimonas sp.]
MLADLLRRLSGRAGEDGPLPADDQRIAVAALLVIAAHADHDYAEAERAQIERVLAARYGLSAEAAAKLRAEGEAAEHASVDLYRFTSVVKAGIPHEERASVIEAMWRVVLSDAEREQHEEALMRRVTDLLGLDPRESVEARRRAQASL